MLKFVPHMGSPIFFVAQNGTAPTAVQSSLGFPWRENGQNSRKTGMIQNISLCGIAVTGLGCPRAKIIPGRNVSAGRRGNGPRLRRRGGRRW